jgi:hypothetical protein
MMTQRPVEERLLNTREWQVVATALHDARLLVSRTANRLADIYNRLSPGSDPRLWTPAQRTTVDLFKHHFKSETGMDAVRVHEAYRSILSALNTLGAEAFRAVGNAKARRDGEGDHYAYVCGRAPPVYLAEAFWAEPPGSSAGTARSAGKATPVTLWQARRLIHVGAHLALGAQHRGGDFGFDSTACAAGHPVKSFAQAYDNAFVYDFFAYCAAR